MGGNGSNFVAAFLVTLLGIPALLLFLNIYRAGINTQMGASWSQCDFIGARRRAAEMNLGDGRVMFFGLSNVLMGIRADQASKLLNRPVVNLGMNANLTNGIIYETLEQSVRPGDAVVLILPWFYFASDTRIDGQFAVVKDYIFDCSPTAYKRLSRMDFLRLALSQNPVQVVVGAFKKMQTQFGLGLLPRQLPEHPMFRLASDGGALNANGDWELNSVSARPAGYLKNIERTSIDAVGRFDGGGNSVAALKEFLSYASKNGVRVVAAWPSAYVTRLDDLKYLAENVRAFYRESGVPLVGDYEEFLFPIERYFDSANHLTIESGNAYTRKIVDQVRPLLDR